MTDPWDAFGEEDDDDDGTDSADKASQTQLNDSNSSQQQDAAVAVSTVLMRRWINHGDIVSLRHRRILLVVANQADESITDATSAATAAVDPELTVNVTCWVDVFSSKGIQDVTINTAKEIIDADPNQNIRCYDAIIWLLSSPMQISSLIRTNESMLIPGGYLLLLVDVTLTDRRDAFVETVWDFESSDIISSKSDCNEVWTIIPKWSCVVDSDSCKWLSTKHSTTNELRLLSTATVSLSVYERENGLLTPTLLNKAVWAIRQHGYCIISGLLHSETKACMDYGRAAVTDIHAAATILKRQGIDLFEPSLSIQEPGIYRELSMREDCRMDIRHGPALDVLRGPSGGTSTTYKASDQGDANVFLRGNKSILSIVRRAMNPTTAKDRSTGNYGRYNFEGSGPDGSDRDLVCGPVGAIVNLPGSGDQAIHADTPHLFEHVIDPSPLPPHYINVFTLGCPAMKSVGQTAFIHGSHSMEFVANHIQDTSDANESRDPFLPSLWNHLIRPRMDLGDVAIFDCRILHFGLSNRHASLPRPMLYSNMTLHWFNDPKNWDERTCIFDNKERSTSEQQDCE